MLLASFIVDSVALSYLYIEALLSEYGHIAIYNVLI